MWNKPNTKQIKQKAWSWIACDGPASGKRNGGYTYISPALSLARQNCPGLQVSMSGVRWKGTFQICSQTKTGRPTSGSNNNSHGLHNVSEWARLWLRVEAELYGHFKISSWTRNVRSAYGTCVPRASLLWSQDCSRTMVERTVTTSWDTTRVTRWATGLLPETQVDVKPHRNILKTEEKDVMTEAESRDAKLLYLKIEEGTMSQGMQLVKARKQDFLLEYPQIWYQFRNISSGYQWLVSLISV